MTERKKMVWRAVKSALAIGCSGLIGTVLLIAYQHVSAPLPASSEDHLVALWDDYAQAAMEAEKDLKRASIEIGLDELEIRAEGYKKAAASSADLAAFHRAEVYFKCILLINPEYEKALLNLGGLYYDFGQWESALPVWEELADLEPTDYHDWLCANVSSMLGRAVEAEIYCRKGLACPDSGWHEKLLELSNAE